MSKESLGEKARSNVQESQSREVTVGKFIFRVREDYLYTEAGVWVSWDNATGLARLGVSDYRQQVNGDAAFIELPAVGQSVREGEDLASIETVKVDWAVLAPFDAVVAATNSDLADAPELINQDPYGRGWLVELRPARWPAGGLLSAEAYLSVMAAQAEEATK